MSDNLLAAVRRYSATGKSNALENFTTEAFAWLLRNDREAERAFLRLVQSKATETVKTQVDVNAHGKWTTQERWENGIPDLIGRFEKFTLVIEIKVDAWGEDDQLTRYVRNIRKYSDKDIPIIGVYLAREPGQYYGKEAASKLLWQEVYEALDKVNQESPSPQASTFLEFLKLEGLAPLEPITYGGWRYSQDVFDMLRAVNMAIPNDNFYLNQFAQKVPNNPFKRRQGWNGMTYGKAGHVWFQQEDKAEWNPQIFTGFFFDTAKSGMPEKILDEGALFAMTIDVSKKYQKELFISKEWDEFVNEWKSKSFTPGWRFYNFKDYGVDLRKKEYEWPVALAVYLPMLEMLRKPVKDLPKDLELTESNYLQELTKLKIIELFEILISVEALPKMLAKAMEIQNSK